MTRKTLLTLAASLLVAALPLSGSHESRAATRSSSYRLSYQIPSGWASDHDLARKRELTALLLPGGKTTQTAEAMITIAFEGKKSGPFVPQTLEKYFYYEMSKLLRIFPEMKSTEWRPDSLDHLESDVDVASLEVYVARRGPMRLVMIDVGDGYYSISLGVNEHELFDREDIKDFFNSLELLPL